MFDPAAAQRGAGGRMRVRLVGDQPEITAGVGGLVGPQIPVDQTGPVSTPYSAPRRASCAACALGTNVLVGIQPLLTLPLVESG